jgi:hypothetical protein
MATLYKTDGEIADVTPKNGEAFSLDEMQKFVGGYIEFVGTPMGQTFIVNEEGLLRGLPINMAVSALTGRPIVGNALEVTVAGAGTDAEAIF